MKPRLGAAGVALLALVLPQAASAALGGRVDSVQMDQMSIKASLRSTSNEKFTVHELETTSGSLVREYSGPDGVVFAVAWQGSTHPRLRQILGDHFAAYVAAAQQQRATHGPVVVREPGLVIVARGHVRAFRGRAYLPEQLPTGVSPSELR
jgi:hypothetical protein